MNIPKCAPIVLVHGLFGFNRLKVAGLTLASYFPGIPELLQQPGNRVLIPALSPTDGTAVRAQQLKEFINRESPHEPVHIFGHSLGGLDARYMISCLGMSERVLTLTTLGTPHRGCSFADWGLGWLEPFLKPIFNCFSVPTQAFHDLTIARCKEFNLKVPDAGTVRYFSVAGQHEGQFSQPLWLPFHSIVYKAEGPNDGVVSVASATYGESISVWEGDHLSLVNWANWLHPWAPHRHFWRNPAPRYGPLIRRLGDEGY